GDDIDIVTPQDDELADLTKKVRRWLIRWQRVADDPVQGWLHRSSWNLEWLQEIGTNPNRDHHRNQDHLHILAPGRFLRCRRVLHVKGMQPFRSGLYGLFIAQT